MSTYTANTEHLRVRLPHHVARVLRQRAREQGISMTRAILDAICGQHVVPLPLRQVPDIPVVRSVVADQSSKQSPAPRLSDRDAPVPAYFTRRVARQAPVGPETAQSDAPIPREPAIPVIPSASKRVLADAKPPLTGDAKGMWSD